jgi:hypothetical protein
VWERRLKARKLLEGASYGPKTVKVICKAFDEAWREVEDHFADRSVDQTLVRERLAHAVLAIATDETSDVDSLKNRALQVFALEYRKREP